MAKEMVMVMVMVMAETVIERECKVFAMEMVIAMVDSNGRVDDGDGDGFYPQGHISYTIWLLLHSFSSPRPNYREQRFHSS